MYGGQLDTSKSTIPELCDADTFWKRVDERLEAPRSAIFSSVVTALQKSKSRDYRD
jgi:hypothetical protein